LAEGGALMDRSREVQLRDAIVTAVGDVKQSALNGDGLMLSHVEFCLAVHDELVREIKSMQNKQAVADALSAGGQA
jgi:hypothetical protein